MRKSGDITRKKIMDTALRIFAQKGFLATKISDISKEADTAHGLLYYYFKDKEDILQAIFTENWQELTKNVHEIISQHQEVISKIDALITYIFELFHNHPELFRVIVINLRYTPEVSQNIRINLLKEFLNPLYEIFILGQKEKIFQSNIDPKIAIQILFGMVENSIRSILIGVIDYNFNINNLMIIKDNVLKIFFNGTFILKKS